MFINISELISTPLKTETFKVPVDMPTYEWQGEHFPFRKKGMLLLNLSNAGVRKVHMEGHWDGSLGIPCDRCLKEVLVCRDHSLVWMKKEELDYAYRHSAFQSHPEWTIIAGKLQLAKSDQREIRSLMDARRERRMSSQPLDLPNCGSVFRNPPQHPAWQLIEEIGYRGKRVGGAMVSDKHANFIVNVGEAKARDVDRLIREIQEKISERYGIELITEVEKFNWNS